VLEAHPQCIISLTSKGTEVASMHTGWICEGNFVVLPHHGLRKFYVGITALI